MVAAYGHGVPIPHDDNDLETRLGQFDTGGKGRGPAVGGMKRIEVNINGQPPGTSCLEMRTTSSLLNPHRSMARMSAPAHDTYAATGAPDVGELFIVAEILMD